MTSHQKALQFNQDFQLQFQQLLETQNSTGALQQLSHLEQQLNHALTFLPTYDVQRFTSQLQQVSNKLKPVKQTKFSFRSKSSQPKVDEAKATFSAQIEIPSDAKCVSNLHNQVVKVQGKQDLYLMNLSGCLVEADSMEIGTLHIQNLKECFIHVGFVNGSIMIEQCEQCILIMGARQVRIHSSHHNKIFLVTSSHPIIEDCFELEFGIYPQLDHPQVINYHQGSNLYDQIEDFNWLKNKQSPNWKLIESMEVSKEKSEFYEKHKQ